MKILQRSACAFLVCFLFFSIAHAQNEVQQRVERYLYTHYNTNKAAIRDNDKTIRLLEDRLDAYMAKLDKEQLEKAKAQERLAKKHLDQVNKLKDIGQLRQFIEEQQQKGTAAQERFLSKGLISPEDVLECRKLIVAKLAEYELLELTQAKLQNLLKNDQARQKFISSLIETEKLAQETDIRLFTRSIDGALDRYSI
jgi:Na+/phosphate symporter